jgi:6-pyruvoyltetrahydropterin/6-carboxytetrahydropterin synthase
MKVSVFRTEHFNAAHRLVNPAWDQEKNEQVFGKCALPNFHGHNYEVRVKVTGEVDPSTGFVMDLKVLSELIVAMVVDRFDHKNLNLDTEEFREQNPTTENFVVVIYNLLRPLIAEHLDIQVRLYETPRNYAEFPTN